MTFCFFHDIAFSVIYYSTHVRKQGGFFIVDFVIIEEITCIPVFSLFQFLIFHSLVYCRQKFSAFQNLYPANVVASYRFKVEVKSVLRIGSAHKKGGPLKPCGNSAFFGLFLN